MSFQALTLSMPSGFVCDPDKTTRVQGGKNSGHAAGATGRKNGAGAEPNAHGPLEVCEAENLRKIARSIAYMSCHLDQPLQVAGLAAQVNISPSHYFALFKRHTGSAPIDYFIRLRMRHACRLLAETAMNVKEVAAALGYDDPFYFSRVFKSVNQVAPSDYRARIAGGSPRTASLALYAATAVPEPTAPALIGMGTLVTCLARRRKV